MSMRYKGGVLSATPPTVTISSAPGLWTMQDQMRYQAAGTWPPAILPDPYFENVVALMHFDGTNGAQNNTFLDSSTNNFTITRNGNTTQGTFSPYGSNWSNYFDGSGDYLSIADNAALDISGDFTIEFWANVDSGNVDRAGIIGHRDQSTFNDGTDWVIRVETSAGKIGFGYDTSGNYYDMGSYVVGEWAHYAITRSGTTIRTFKNGTQVATATNGSTWSSTAAFLIGRNISGFDYKGFLSNVRLVKGTAVYTSNFTPPTAPLTAIANTSLLTCQSNRFKDNSTNAFAITPSGNTSVQAFSPFNPTTAYSTTTNGGSGYFDGSGDYLSATNSGAFDMNTSFTAEAWVYQTNSSNSGGVMEVGGGAASWSTSNGHEWLLLSNYNGTLYFQYNASNSPGQITATGAPLNQWNHIAVGYNGTTASVWLNGTRVGTASISVTLPTTRNIFAVGNFSSLDAPMFGYISNARVVRGTDVYGVSNTTITVPTAPLTAITNTSLLCNFTNGGAFDNAAIEDYETVGSSQLSTTQFKFGTSSLVLNGTTSSFQNTLRGATTSDNFKLGTGPFTIEGFLRLNSSTISYPYVWNLYNPGTGVSVLTMFFGDAGYGYRTLFYHNNNLIDTATSAGAQSVYLNTWKHFAIVRQANGTFTYYIDGTSVYSSTVSTDLGSSKLHFGNYGDGSTYGYLDEFRITKGVARYTSNFTPPTAAFPNL